MVLRWLAALLLAGAVAGCSRVQDEAVLPWCRYRHVIGPGGSGIWGGASHSEVHVRRFWGWSTVFDGNAGPGRPIVVDDRTALVLVSGVGYFLRSSGAPSVACGDPKAAVEVPPTGGFVDCVDHLAGPAPAVATALRVRRLRPDGTLASQQELTTGVQGRVFLTPSVRFYDEAATAYLVSFRDPWAGEPGAASPERMEAIACELIPVVAPPLPAILAPPGTSLGDCSSRDLWSRALGRPLAKGRAS